MTTDGAALPCGLAKDRVARLQRDTRGSGNIVQSNPGRIADDEVEPAACVGRPEMGRKREGQCAAIEQPAAVAAESARAKSLRAHLLPNGNRGCSAFAEEVEGALCAQPLATPVQKRGELAVDRGDGALAFFAVERSAQRHLLRAGGAHVALAQLHEHAGRPEE